MRFLFYAHSLVSDWNHGNAHFLRGVMRELISRGHEAVALEPANGWSRANLLEANGEAAKSMEETKVHDGAVNGDGKAKPEPQPAPPVEGI